MAELFELIGVLDLQARMQVIAQEVVFLGGIALQQEADAILDASQPLVPVDTGSLKASGKVDTISIAGPVVSTAVRYGGTAGVQGRVPERYAWIVHEDTTKRHSIGQSHYLSQPTFAATQGMLARIAEQIRNGL